MRQPERRGADLGADRGLGALWQVVIGAVVLVATLSPFTAAEEGGTPPEDVRAADGVRVSGPDDHGLDADHDGAGCESY